MIAESHVGLVALRTLPHILGVATLSHLDGRGVVWVPLLEKPWVCSYRLALAEALVALTERADEVASTPSQTVYSGFPLVLSPAPMFAAWA